jgi:hypothetical protein
LVLLIPFFSRTKPLHINSNSHTILRTLFQSGYIINTFFFCTNFSCS